MKTTRICFTTMTLLILSIVMFESCSSTNVARYDSNSDKYKRMYSIHTSPPKTK